MQALNVFNAYRVVLYLCMYSILVAVFKLADCSQALFFFVCVYTSKKGTELLFICYFM